jgi:hypothetical protein
MIERDHLGDAGVDGRIILRGIFRKRGVGYITTKLLSIITRFKLKMIYTPLYWVLVGKHD